MSYEIIYREIKLDYLFKILNLKFWIVNCLKAQYFYDKMKK